MFTRKYATRGDSLKLPLIYKMASIGEIEFFNFLQRYDLQQYHERLRDEGIKKISHLQHVKSEDLEKIGMTKPERKRLLGKYEQHFSKFGKLKVMTFLCCGFKLHIL